MHYKCPLALQLNNLPGGRWRCGSTGISPLVHIKLLPLRDPSAGLWLSRSIIIPKRLSSHIRKPSEFSARLVSLGPKYLALQQTVLLRLWTIPANRLKCSMLIALTLRTYLIKGIKLSKSVS